MHDQAERLRKRLGRENKQAKTIAIVSGKGGVGKSNTALNFSISLQKKGKKVLLIDLDVGMGNIDILLGNQTKYSIANLFNEFMPLHDIIELGPFDLSYITGGTSLNKLLDLGEDKLEYFFSEYEKAVYEYDYILFDLGAGATPSSLSFVLAADECFVITTTEPTAIMDAYSMIKHITLKQSDVPFSVLINRCESTIEGEQVLERFAELVSKFLKCNISKLGMLPNDKTVHKAVLNQTPYILYDKRAAVSIAVEEIVNNYLYEKNNINQLKSSSFVQRLKRLLRRGNENARN